MHYVRVPRTKIGRPSPKDWTAIDEAITGVITRATKDQQGVIREFMLGRDVFVGLPTGSGKSVCYAALSFVFDILRARAGSVAVVVCPLQSIMED